MPYNNLLKDAAASIKPFINMNSTFSKMAPYIKLLLDILTGNRISLSRFPPFLISFPPAPFFSLSLWPPPQSVCLSCYPSKPSSLLPCSDDSVWWGFLTWWNIQFGHLSLKAAWEQLQNPWGPWWFCASLASTRAPAVEGGGDLPWIPLVVKFMAHSWARKQTRKISISGSSLLLRLHQHLTTE